LLHLLTYCTVVSATTAPMTEDVIADFRVYHELQTYQANVEVKNIPILVLKIFNEGAYLTFNSIFHKALN